MMVLMSKLWNTQFLSFYDGDIPCGFIYFAVNRKMIFIMFLAVDESLRTKGYGSAILKGIKIDILIRKSLFPLSHAMIVRQI